jgi:hypothetical protein
MNINNIILDDNFIDNFYAFADNPRPVEVKWGDQKIHDITGPNPLIDISKTFNSNEAGIVESIVHSVTLTGKIIKPDKRGITNVVSGIKNLEDLFKACEAGILEIICDGTSLIKATGVMVKNISFNKTNDNWVNSADYTVELEYKTGGTDDPADQVENRSDSWTIEPMDDAIYTNFSRNSVGKPETFNPKLGEALSRGSQSTIGSSTAGGGVQIFNIPQFRVTRRLSAKGLVKPSGTGDQQCLEKSTIEGKEAKFFLSAKAWVDDQTKKAFNGSTASGNLFFTSAPNISSYNQTWLYNHSRTINIDIYNATYETNDSWIAMPTGVGHTESFTIEASTDAENTKTVRVAGNIQGLRLTPINIMDGTAGPIPTTPQGSSPIADPLQTPDNNMQIKLCNTKNTLFF